MAGKAKATDNPEEATIVPSIEEMSLDQLKAKIAQLESEKVAQEQKIEKLEGKEEGWLITVDNPEYDGRTEGVQFVNGQAWIPKDRVFPNYVRQMPNKTEIQKEANERFKFDHETTFDDVKAEFETTAKITSAEFLVKLLTTSREGYHTKFYTKEDVAELEKVRLQRVKERAEVEARQGKMKDNYDKMIREYTHIGSA